MLAFSYPDPTPEGHMVIRDEQPLRSYARVHLSSPDRHELYLEVVRFHDLTAHGEYKLHKPFLEERFGTGSISALTKRRHRDRSAFAYDFGWTEGERFVARSVLLFDIAGETYRVVFDPRSELNVQVIDTITTADSLRDAQSSAARAFRNDA